jgi:hypothetical protein
MRFMARRVKDLSVSGLGVPTLESRHSCMFSTLVGVKARMKFVKSQRAVALSLEATSQLCWAM